MSFTGQSDVEPHLQVLGGVLSTARETMDHRRRQALAERLQDRDQLRVRLALVDKQRLLQLAGQRHLEDAHANQTAQTDLDRAQNWQLCKWGDI